MKYKKLYAVAGIILLAAVIVFQISKKRHYHDYTPEKVDGLPPLASSDAVSRTAATEDSQILETLTEVISVINDDTLNTFKFLQHKFRKSLNLDDHLNKIREYLFSAYDSDYAETVFETYKVWLECEMLVTVEFSALSSTRSPQEISDKLKAIHEFRKNNMGEKLAGILYGAELDKKLYNLNLSSIVNNNELYGLEKETLIEELELAHPDTYTYSNVPYDNYQQKLKLYDRDLNEVSSISEREELIKRIREATLPPETVKKLESIDDGVRQNQEKEELYTDRRNMILEDATLSPNDKEDRLNRLRSEVFGTKGAQAKARMENLEKGYQKIISGLKTEE